MSRVCAENAARFSMCTRIFFFFYFSLLIIDSVLMAWRKLLLKTKTIAGNREQHFQTHLVFSTCHIISDDEIGSETIILLETNYCFPRIKFVFPFLPLFFFRCNAHVSLTELQPFWRQKPRKTSKKIRFVVKLLEFLKSTKFVIEKGINLFGCLALNACCVDQQWQRKIHSLLHRYI